MINKLHHSSLNRIPRPKRKTRLHQRLKSNTNDQDNNIDTNSNQETQSDKSSTSSSYQPSHSSSCDESILSNPTLKFSSCKTILFPKQIQSDDHSQSSSIDIHNIHLQTNHRSLFHFPLMFPKIDPNIITLHQNEDIPSTICGPNTCHDHISPVASPLDSPRYIPDSVYNTKSNHQKRLPITLLQPKRKT